MSEEDKTQLNMQEANKRLVIPRYIPLVMTQQCGEPNGVANATYANYSIQGGGVNYNSGYFLFQGIGSGWNFNGITLQSYKDPRIGTQLTNNYMVHLVAPLGTDRGIVTLTVTDNLTNASWTIGVIDLYNGGAFQRRLFGFDFSGNYVTPNPGVNASTIAPMPFDDRSYTLSLTVTGKNASSSSYLALFEKITIFRYTQIGNINFI